MGACYVECCGMLRGKIDGQPTMVLLSIYNQKKIRIKKEAESS